MGPEKISAASGGAGVSKRAVVLWTGGKDCNLALYDAKREGYEIVALVTFAPGEGKFRAHPIHVMKLQAEALGIPHAVIPVSEPYEESYEQAILNIKKEYGIGAIITGDIAEVHGQANWITERSRPAGIEVVLPLWHADREALLQRLLKLNFKAIFSCVKEPWFGRDWLGRELNAEVLGELHILRAEKGLDLCGEQGEYHTLVINGPNYRSELRLGAFVAKQEKGMRYLEIGNPDPNENTRH